MLYFQHVLLNKHNLNDQVKEDDVSRNAARMGHKRNAYRILVVKPEGKSPQGRPTRRWLDNITMDLK
jgi:hypothetical protein